MSAQLRSPMTKSRDAPTRSSTDGWKNKIDLAVGTKTWYSPGQPRNLQSPKSKPTSPLLRSGQTFEFESLDALSSHRSEFSSKSPRTSAYGGSPRESALDAVDDSLSLEELREEIESLKSKVAALSNPSSPQVSAQQAPNVDFDSPDHTSQGDLDLETFSLDQTSLPPPESQISEEEQLRIVNEVTASIAASARGAASRLENDGGSSKSSESPTPVLAPSAPLSAIGSPRESVIGLRDESPPDVKETNTEHFIEDETKRRVDAAIKETLDEVKQGDPPLTSVDREREQREFEEMERDRRRREREEEMRREMEEEIERRTKEAIRQAREEADARQRAIDQQRQEQHQRALEEALKYERQKIWEADRKAAEKRRLEEMSRRAEEQAARMEVEKRKREQKDAHDRRIAMSLLRTPSTYSPSVIDDEDFSSAASTPRTMLFQPHYTPYSQSPIASVRSQPVKETYGSARRSADDLVSSRSLPIRGPVTTARPMFDSPAFAMSPTFSEASSRSSSSSETATNPGLKHYEPIIPSNHRHSGIDGKIVTPKPQQPPSSNFAPLGMVLPPPPWPTGGRSSSSSRSGQSSASSSGGSSMPSSSPARSAPPNQNEDELIVVSSPNVSGHQITTTLGQCWGTAQIEVENPLALLSRNDELALQLKRHGRRAALKALVSEAEVLGATAIVNLRFKPPIPLNEQQVQFSAFGSAVVLEAMTPRSNSYPNDHVNFSHDTHPFDRVRSPPPPSNPFSPWSTTRSNSIPSFPSTPSSQGSFMHSPRGKGVG